MLKNIYMIQIYIQWAIHIKEKVLYQLMKWEKGIMNNNMKMKNTEYKIVKKNIVYIMKGDGTWHGNLIEHTIWILF